MSSHASNTPVGKPQIFATTQWTRVLATQGRGEEAHAALADLCDVYWHPIHRWLRREYPDDQAKELAQEFFARLLSGNGVRNARPERGRFRSFLLGALKHFLADHRDRERSGKRGGGCTPESLDALADADTSAENQRPHIEIADPKTEPSDVWFDREWALALMSRTVARLEAEFRSEGKHPQFEILKPWLGGDAETTSQQLAAQRLEMSEGSVKVAIHRLRKRLRELIRREILETVENASRVDEELLYLVEVLTRVSE